jgi:hypothetical protein
MNSVTYSEKGFETDVLYAAWHGKKGYKVTVNTSEDIQTSASVSATEILEENVCRVSMNQISP